MAGRGSQRFGKADVYFGGNGGMTIENAGKDVARNTDVLGERRHAHVQVVNPTLQQFAGVGGVVHVHGQAALGSGSIFGNGFWLACHKSH